MPADCPQYNSADPPEPTTSLDKFQSIRRTGCSNIADCPQFNSAIPPEATTPLDKILISTVDGPQFTLLIPPETITSLDKILDYTADCPLSNSGPSAVQPCEPHQRQHRLWTKSNMIGGLSAPPRRTIRDA